MAEEQQTQEQQTQEQQSNEATEQAPDRTAVDSLLARAGIGPKAAELADDARQAPGAEKTPEGQAEPDTDQAETPEQVKKQHLANKKAFRRLNRQTAEFEAKQKEFQEKLDLLEADPVAFLQSKGITLSQWAKQQAETPEVKMRREIAALRQEMQQEKEQAQKHALEKESARQDEEMKAIIAAELTKKSDQYAIMNAYIEEGLLPKDIIYPALLEDVQKLYDETEETDVSKLLGKVFDRYENQYESQMEKALNIYQRLKGTKGTKGGGKPRVEVTPIAKSNGQQQTLTNKSITVESTEKEPTSPAEIEAMVKRKFGFG